MELVTLSAFGWLLCVSVFLSLQKVNGIALIFVLGAAYQLVVTCIALLVNIKIRGKKSKEKIGAEKKAGKTEKKTKVLKEKHKKDKKAPKRKEISADCVVENALQIKKEEDRERQ